MNGLQGLPIEAQANIRRWLQIIGLNDLQAENVKVVANTTVVWCRPGDIPEHVILFNLQTDGSPPPLCDEELSTVLSSLAQIPAAHEWASVAMYRRMANEHLQMRILGETLGSRLLKAVAFIHRASGAEWDGLLRLFGSPLPQEVFEEAGEKVRMQTDVLGKAVSALWDASDFHAANAARDQRTVKDPQQDAPAPQKTE